MKFLLAFLLLLSSNNIAQEIVASNTINPDIVKQEEALEEIKKTQDQALQESAQAVKRDDKSQKELKKAISLAEKMLASYISSIQSYRKDLSELKLAFINQKEEQIASIKKQTDLLKRFDDSSANKFKSIKDLSDVTDIWRTIVDHKLTNLFSTKEFATPPPPELPQEVDLSTEALSPQKKNIKEVIEQSEQERQALYETVEKFNNLDNELSSQLLLSAGRIRAKYMNLLIDQGKYSVWSVNEHNYKDYIREIKIVPFRFLAIITEQVLKFRGNLSSGISGWFNILKEIFVLFIIIALPIIFFRTFSRFSEFLDRFRNQLFLRSNIDYKKRTRVALLINRINPYLPWLFAILSLEILHGLLIQTVFNPLTIIIPYFKIYTWYRIVKLLLGSLLESILLAKNLQDLRANQIKVRKTARKLSIIAFLEITLLHLTRDTVREALIYNIIIDIVTLINIAFIVQESKQWKNEILNIAKLWTNPKLFTKLTALNGWLADSILLPILLIGNFLYFCIFWFYQWLRQYEIGKKISSEIFKKKLEDASSGKKITRGDLPNSYKDIFSQSFLIDEKLRVPLSRTPFNECEKLIKDWLSEDSLQDMFVMYGNYGIGKSTLLNSLNYKFSKSISIANLIIKNKITASSELFQSISTVIGFEFNSAEEFEEKEKTIGKTLIIIDDIHNLYINKSDGLEAYRALINLSSLQTSNVFWCLSCNERAWIHLKGIFGKRHFLGNGIDLLSWSDVEIQELLISRHQRSGFNLKFDRVLNSVHRRDVLDGNQDIDVQFFRLLWGQSRGNPCTAQQLWLSSTCLVNEKTIRVSVPEFTNNRAISSLDEDSLLVLATITKHETLTFGELLEISNLQTSSLKQILKQNEDSQLLLRSTEKQWMIHPKSQYIVHAHLLERNLIYE